MRTAVNHKKVSTVESGWGNNVKRFDVTENMVAIDGKYSITSQNFINKLVEKGRIDYSFMKKRTQLFTDEWLTKMLNVNSDLFSTEI